MSQNIENLLYSICIYFIVSVDIPFGKALFEFIGFQCEGLSRAPSNKNGTSAVLISFI